MYTNAVTAAAYGRFWTAWANRLRSHGLVAPASLTLCDDYESVWTHPDLLLSQTCGYPYASRLRGKVRLVATPHYDVEGCDGPNYVSWIIARKSDNVAGLEDLRDRRATVNGSGSQSGYNSFRAVIAPLANRKAFFSEIRTSGGHMQSMRDVANGLADCAAIDAVSWALGERAEPEIVAKLTRVAATPSVPGLPFITSGTRPDVDLATIRETLHEALNDPVLTQDLQVLRLKGASVVPDHAYNSCLDMEATAVAAGYPALA